MGFPPPSEKQARILWASLTALAAAVFLALVALLAWGMVWMANKLSSVLLPLALAGILACLLDPLVGFFVRRGVPRVRAILLVFFVAVFLLITVLAMVVPRLAIEADSMIRSVPEQVRIGVKKVIENRSVKNTLLDQWNILRVPLNWIEGTPPSSSTNGILELRNSGAPPSGQFPAALAPMANADLLERAIGWGTRLGGWALEQLSRFLSWTGFLIGLSLVPVYAFYFLLEKEKIEANWTDYLPLRESKTKEELVFVLKSINYYLVLFFRGQVLVALCDGLLYTVGLVAIGLNYGFLIGFLAGILSVVPYLGFVLSILPALLLASVQFGDWLHPALVLAVFAAVQTLEGLVISPKIMGDRVGLHPLTIIIAVIIGTTLLGGLLGAILAIPLTAALRVLMFRYVWKGRRNSTEGN